jgi:DNA adenine methylase
MSIIATEILDECQTNFLVSQTGGLKPLIKWSGGKYDELKYIRPHCLDHSKVDLYIEPFVGGGAVFFDREYYQSVISDVHEGLINFYQQIKNGKSLEIYKLVSKFGNDEKSYYWIRDEFEPKTGVECAARFYYLRKTCFRGMLRYNKSGKFNIPYGKYKSININDLKNPWYEKLLKNTDIRMNTFEEIFDKFNDENNFMFLDPPYDSTFTNYGYCSFTKDHHRKLSDCFKTTRNKCLLVIGETDFIKELYKSYIIDSYRKNYSFKIYGGRVSDEINNNHLIIRNY